VPQDQQLASFESPTPRQQHQQLNNSARARRRPRRSRSDDASRQNGQLTPTQQATIE